MMRRENIQRLKVMMDDMRKGKKPVASSKVEKMEIPVKMEEPEVEVEVEKVEEETKRKKKIVKKEEE
jgi:hypothetical protein